MAPDQGRPLTGRTAIVTGAARGLGRAYALRIAGLGANVVISDIDLAGAAKFGERLSAASVAQELEALGVGALDVEGDLSRPEDVDRLFAAAIGRFGTLDILVNNAGGAIANASSGLASETSPEDVRLLFDVNFTSMVLCSQAAARIMKGQGRGIIVNTASQTGVSTYPGGNLAAYGASKAAVLQYTRSLAAELGPYGIRANCIAPGIIMTARIAEQAQARGIGTDEQAASIPLRRLGNVDDCAGVIEFLVTDLSQYVTGQCISACGGAVLTPS